MFANIATLDKNWVYYITNRRPKIKKLPLGPGDIEGADVSKHP